MDHPVFGQQVWQGDAGVAHGELACKKHVLQVCQERNHWVTTDTPYPYTAAGKTEGLPAPAAAISQLKEMAMRDTPP